MNKTMRSKSLLVRFAISALVIGPCLLAPQAAFSEDKGQPKNPGILVPRETFLDEKDKEKPKVPLLTCGKCPEGYVKTAVGAPLVGPALGADFDTSDICKGLFKSEESTLVECKPIGFQDQMPVCGACPEGYREVGRLLLPALCGNEDGGLRTQCQLQKMERGFPDPTKGGIFCPPKCPGQEQQPTPGKGFLPLPPKIPSIEIRKEKPEESP